ncbi:MAG: hypothetical protein RLZZ226_735 [Pseudomonadota bacterium]
MTTQPRQRRLAALLIGTLAGSQSALALPGTFDVYYDSGTPNGAKYRAYFFTTDGTKVPGRRMC